MRILRESLIALWSSRVTLVALLACGLSACKGDATGASAPTEATLASSTNNKVIANGLEFTVGASQVGTNLLRVVYTVKNVSTSEITYANTDCSRDQRLYDSHEALVYSLVTFRHVCVGEGLRFVLAPGTQQTWDLGLSVAEILASVSVGTYSLAVTLPNVAPEVEVTAGIVQVR
jgi:hypothetical protein